ncbi:hypothetical protein GINT2_001668 [Glugoides intestinalis]
MYKKYYESDKICIEAELENNSEIVSFESCFLYEGPEVLPSTFKVRDGRVFSTKKLMKCENKLIKVFCKGKVTFKDLQKFLPTVFSFNEIKKINERLFVKENHNQIIELTKNILGRDKIDAILKRKL